MKAGRELDALVAEKVMGLEYHDESYGHYDNIVKRECWYRDGIWVCAGSPPNYSTDIAAAWEVLEKLHGTGFDIDIEIYKTSGGQMNHRVNVMPSGTVDAVVAFANTAPHSICLAALKAVGYETDHTLP